MNKVLWVLVGNSSSAQIYEVKGRGKNIEKVHVLDHPSSRLKTSEINSDRPGRSFDKGGIRRHALSSDVDAHRQERIDFAIELSHFLEKEKNENKFEELALIAPPDFLGELNQALPALLQKIVVKGINKDIPSYLTEQERVDRLCEYLELFNHHPTRNGN